MLTCIDQKQVEAVTIHDGPHAAPAPPPLRRDRSRPPAANNRRWIIRGRWASISACRDRDREALERGKCACVARSPSSSPQALVIDMDPATTITHSQRLRRVCAHRRAPHKYHKYVPGGFI